MSVFDTNIAIESSKVTKLTTGLTTNSDLNADEQDDELDASNDEEDSELDETIDGTQVEISDGTFKPLYLMSLWTETQTRTKRNTLAIVLPSGIQKGQFSFTVLDGGVSCQLVLDWPEPLNDIITMHRKWLRDGSMAEYHPVIGKFNDALSKLRAHKEGVVQSTCLIPLAFKVQAFIYRKESLRCSDSNVCLLYFDLKAKVNSYAGENDQDSFTEVYRFFLLVETNTFNLIQTNSFNSALGLLTQN